MKSEDMAERAKELFEKGVRCSQAVFIAGAERLGRDAPDVFAALGTFGGGLSSTGRVCGCLPGALAIVGMSLAGRSPDEKEHKALVPTGQTMIKAFEAITAPYGGINCVDIARVDWTDKAQVRVFRKDPNSRRQECKKVVAATAEALGQLLDKVEREEGKLTAA